ncbi:hypothetical protein K432DRAFT_354063 [Lepidopterella palustris CBS 459.81]|uniref:ORC6 first cyclin-like domain-containing protein n=1 Tax=Lepidopterella palustris CBS 459.81 TaxID=1314670 RepID=A0A8E2E9Q9_9PEZI|nr:hypothetical protein K432DRAFT_354063 [Lepidopterella palustris CBS 459.81]
MNKSIEQSLIGLIPSFSGPLPPDLINLALSLLAQSRSKASSLRPEEEIARPYACAQLACERLKKRLNLPPIVSRPPCPPQAYKKLHAYLSTALPERPTRNASTPSTPQKPARKANTPIQTPTGRTPAKATPLRSTHSKRAGDITHHPHPQAQHAVPYEEAPDWVMPTIRHLCRAFSTPAAAPHVFTGVSTVLALQKSSAGSAATPSRTNKRARTANTVQEQGAGLVIAESQILALIAVLLFYVLARITNKETTPDEFAQQRDMAISILRGMELEAARGVDEEEMLRDVESFMRLAQSQGWVRMEWFLNVVQGDNRGEEGEGGDVDNLDDGGVKGLGARKRRGGAGREDVGGGNGGLQIGLGTMMQEKIDYLSEEKRKDYLLWKAEIMARVERIEREQAENGRNDEMELVD